MENSQAELDSAVTESKDWCRVVEESLNSSAPCDSEELLRLSSHRPQLDHLSQLAHTFIQQIITGTLSPISSSPNGGYLPTKTLTNICDPKRAV